MEPSEQIFSFFFLVLLSLVLGVGVVFRRVCFWCLPIGLGFFFIVDLLYFFIYFVRDASIFYCFLFCIHCNLIILLKMFVFPLPLKKISVTRRFVQQSGS